MFLVLPYKKNPLRVEDPDNSQVLKYTLGNDIKEFKYTDGEGQVHKLGIVGTATLLSPAQVLESPKYASKYNGGVTDFLRKECGLFGSIVGDVIMFGLTPTNKPTSLPTTLLPQLLAYIPNSKALGY